MAQDLGYARSSKYVTLEVLRDRTNQCVTRRKIYSQTKARIFVFFTIITLSFLKTEHVYQVHIIWLFKTFLTIIYMKSKTK